MCPRCDGEATLRAKLSLERPHELDRNPGRVVGFTYLLLVFIGPFYIIYIPMFSSWTGTHMRRVTTSSRTKRSFAWGCERTDRVDRFIFRSPDSLPVAQGSGPEPRRTYGEANGGGDVGGFDEGDDP